jgi:hypothetical protein
LLTNRLFAAGWDRASNQRGRGQLATAPAIAVRYVPENDFHFAGWYPQHVGGDLLEPGREVGTHFLRQVPFLDYAIVLSLHCWILVRTIDLAHIFL